MTVFALVEIGLDFSLYTIVMNFGLIYINGIKNYPDVLFLLTLSLPPSVFSIQEAGEGDPVPD